MKRNKRKRVFADLKIQGGTSLRIAIYWFTCYFVTIGTIFGFAALEGPGTASGSVARFFVPAFVVAVLVLPLALLDALVFTNRFAGPMLNFRRRFGQLASGQPTQEMSFRPGDHLQDVCENFNKVRATLLDQHFTQVKQEDAEFPVGSGV